MAEWNVVSKKKGRRIRSAPEPKINEPKFPGQARTRTQSQIEECMKEISGHDFWRKFSSILDTCLEFSGLSPSSIVCLGVGSMTQWENSRYQLALLKLLVEKLDIDFDSVLCFDPLFNSVDRRILSECGFTVSDTNDEGKYDTGDCTIFYMPCCPHILYDNILRANWTSAKLSKILVIGNGFGHLATHVPDDCCLVRASKISQERYLPSFQEISERAFAGQSLHYWTELESVDANVWATDNCPILRRGELITQKFQHCTDTYNAYDEEDS